jgi:ParB family transcriptional regulator, chromosome partitioning protein
MSAGEEPRRRGLGRGLSALLGEPSSFTQPSAAEGGSELSRALRSLPVETLRPGRFQPRRVFDQAAIEDLVHSVREKGILQPLVVRRHPDEPEFYEIIAGERRWRAAQAAGLHEVPAIVRDLSDREALEVALIENLQRQDLSPLEEAEGYRRLMDDFAHTQEELAKAVGKSRSHVANMMRLLALPQPVKQMLDQGELTAGHARALLTSGDPVGLARQVVAKALNVRQTEKLVQKRPDQAKSRPLALAKDADVVALERDLAAALGLKVTIGLRGQGGELTIHYGTLEQLDDVLHRLTNGQQGRREQECLEAAED